MILSLVAIAMTYSQMLQFQFVQLETGPKKIKMSAEQAQVMHKQHLDNLKKLLDSGTAIAVGPVVDGGDLRGLVIVKAKDAHEAQAMFKSDPYVREELLVARCSTWNTMVNPFGKRTAGFTDVETCWIGFLRRPKNAPTFAEQELNKLQEGHLANITAMHKVGDLIAAGPMSDDTPLRGLLFFRDIGKSRIEELVNKDPMIKAKRLELKLFQWMIPKGLIQARKAE